MLKVADKLKKIRSVDKKKTIKVLLLVRLPFTIYLLISLIMVPGINSVGAQVIQGAHRGASVDFEENTMEAFEKALADSTYKFVEFDIFYTADNKIAVFHKNNIVRIPKKFVNISEMTYDELNAKFEFEIPKYEDVMKLLAGKIPLDIEIKSCGDVERDIALAEFVVQDCNERGILHEVMISAIQSEVVEYIEENYPEVKTGQIHWVTLKSIIPINSICDDIYETPADYVLLHGHNLRNYETLVECKPEDKTLMFWYFTDELYIVDDGNNCEFWEECKEVDIPQH